VYLEGGSEVGDGEGFEDLLIDRAEAELTLCRFHVVVNGDERAERCGGEVVDVFEVEDELRFGGVGDEVREFVADLLDVRFIEDGAIDELDVVDACLFFDSESRTLGGHGMWSPRELDWETVAGFGN